MSLSQLAEFPTSVPVVLAESDSRVTLPDFGDVVRFHLDDPSWREKVS
jgi:hypothetical protein